MSARTLLSVLACAAVLTSARAEGQVGYQVDVGAAFPLGSNLSERAEKAGVHAGLGAYYVFSFGLGVGLRVTYDTAFSRSGQCSGARTCEDAQFASVMPSLMYTGGTWYRYWVALSGGIFFNLVPRPATIAVAANNEIGFGMDFGAGISFKVWRDLALGPAVSVTLPNVRRLPDDFLVSAGLRIQWGL